MTAVRVVVTCLCAAMLGCGGSVARDGDTTPGGGSAAAAAKAVELAEITVYEHDRPLVHLHADGTSEIEHALLHDTPAPDGTWEPGPTFAADGTVTVDGTDIARINPDGTIIDLLTQSSMPITLTADRVTAARDGMITGFALAESGAVSRIKGAITTELPIRVEGATTPIQRRTVLGFLVLLFQKPDGA